MTDLRRMSRTSKKLTKSLRILWNVQDKSHKQKASTTLKTVRRRDYSLMEYLQAESNKIIIIITNKTPEFRKPRVLHFK